MPKIFKQCLETIKEGHSSLKNIKNDKQQYKEYLERIKKLPDDYKFAYKKISDYMWNNFGGGSGYDMMEIQADLLDLFETGAAEGKYVLQITGEDVAAFCDELLRNAETQAENQRQKLNREIIRKLVKRIKAE